MNESIWDIAVKVEENGYYWKGEPVLFNRVKKAAAKPGIFELFSGCGGTSKGFEMAGFNVLLGADIHSPSVETFRQNHSNASTILGNLKNVTVEEMEMCTGSLSPRVMIAGVPCQGFSLNNRKRHKGDERNFLFKEYMRFVKHFLPDVVMLENVSGLKSMGEGAFVRAITESFQDAGYSHVEYRMLNAADFGVPQLRHRIVFLGFRRSVKFEWPTPTHGPGLDNPYVTVRDAMYDLPFISSGERSDVYRIEPSGDYQNMMRNGSRILYDHVAPKHPISVIKKIAKTKPGEPIYPKFKQRIRLHWDRPSPTQVSGGIRPQFQFGHPEVPRGETVRERCRLQSFPDDFIVSGGVTQSRVQTGNAVPPLLAKAIAKQIIKVID